MLGSSHIEGTFTAAKAQGVTMRTEYETIAVAYGNINGGTGSCVIMTNISNNAKKSHAAALAAALDALTWPETQYVYVTTHQSGRTMLAGEYYSCAYNRESVRHKGDTRWTHTDF